MFKSILQSVIRFHIGLFKMGPFVMMWLGLLVLINGVLPLYFMPAMPAVVTFSIFLIGFALMIVLTHTYGFTRILGMGHFLWIPLVIYLITEIDFEQLSDFYNLWLTSLIICNSISLVIDISDVYRYIQGDKAELVDFAPPPS